MGLLDRWSKRKQQEQLEKTDEKTVAAEKKVEAKITKTETKKAPAKKAVAKVAAKKAEPVAVATPAVVEKKDVLASKVLVKPLVTEKAAVAESLNKYSFLVHRSANKHQVKLAVLAEYGIKPVAVNMVNVQGKWVRFGKSIGRHSDYRKAIITLPKGKTIAIHQGV